MKSLLILALMLIGCEQRSTRETSVNGFLKFDICKEVVRSGTGYWLSKDSKHNFCLLTVGHSAAQVDCSIFDQCFKEVGAEE